MSKSTFLVTIVLIFSLLCFARIEYCLIPARERPIQITNAAERMWLDKNCLDYWIDGRDALPGDLGTLTVGPKVLRVRGRPAFIWQIESARAWGFRASPAYVIVVDGVDSMDLLTRFSTGSTGWEPRIITTGALQGDDAGSTPFFLTYNYEIVLNDQDVLSSGVNERLIVQGASEERLFDLSEGRVFLVRRQWNEEFVFEQSSFDVPGSDVIDAPGKSGLDRHRLLEDWYLKASQGN